ncbi:HTH-type transcriptional repressor CsiR [Planctomycetes bacterium Pan216]|uniref:HTH-type transcriptional repressor CsiR n=1 Tax=Kolteria novifilia TaxID=2527975 RepID=A0A518B4T0_9BACT|nr:HTH-type transcriptional repressor CsiR [Planctomycetes bacterium Pan216]
MGSETHASRAYRHLREKLISGRYEPGERLLYGPIGKEIGISATPVREAAGQLAKEGFLELIPQLGAVVRTIDRAELVELYEVRLAIEPFAARLAAERATKRQVARIARELSRMEELALRQKSSASESAGKRLEGQFDKADYGFHLAVIESTGNQAMVRTAGQSHVLTRVFGIRRHRYTASSMLTTCEEHVAILRAIEAGDGETAAQAASAHINHGLELSLAAMEGRES